MTSKAENHPEALPGEVVLQNGTRADYDRLMSFRTKRLGNVAYDWNDDPLVRYGLHPIFVQRWELEQKGTDPDVFAKFMKGTKEEYAARNISHVV